MLARFSTANLAVFELSSPLESYCKQQLLSAAMAILTTAVVEQLPDHFKQISTLSAAALWYKRMLSDGRMLLVKNTATGQFIGYIFLSIGDQHNVHIGYVLGEQHWRKGFATEVLAGFIKWAQQQRPWHKLIAGVAADNISSNRLLLKMGFIRPKNIVGETYYYHFNLDNQAEKSR